MFGLTEWKQTRFYKEVKAEGLQEGRQEREEEILSTAIPRMLNAGLSIEEIAVFFNIDVETVRKIANRDNS